MNREDLYREISKLAPYMRGGDDYRDVFGDRETKGTICQQRRGLF